jgi:hypothetical protein
VQGDNLIQELRRRIKDQQYAVSSLTIGISDSTVTSADLGLRNGMLTLTVTGGTSVRGFSVDLLSPDLDTVGKLREALQRFLGVVVQVDRDEDPTHLCADYEPFGDTRCYPQAVTLRHRVFSDYELEQILSEALKRHNPGYSLRTVPVAEEGLVLTLAEAVVFRRRAGDVSKRRGVEASVSDLLALANALDGPGSQYEQDARRLRNALGKVPDGPASRIGTGDVAVGYVWRRSARNGFKTPMAVAPPAEAPLLLESQDGDAEDTNVRVRWEKSQDLYFHSYELWMDVQPEVLPLRESILLSGLPVPSSGAPDSNQGVDRLGTSKLVFRAFGASSNYSTVAFATFIESYGQNITQFNVPTLEPDTDYWFRLRTVDINFVGQLSNVVRIRTRSMRVMFDPTTPYTPSTGAVGSTVTVRFDSTKGVPDSLTKFSIGGKDVTLTFVSTYVATFVVPSFRSSHRRIWWCGTSKGWWT